MYLDARAMLTICIWHENQQYLFYLMYIYTNTHIILVVFLAFGTSASIHHGFSLFMFFFFVFVVCCVSVVCVISFSKQIFIVKFLVRRECACEGFIVYLCKVLSAFVYYFIWISVHACVCSGGGNASFFCAVWLQQSWIFCVGSVDSCKCDNTVMLLFVNLIPNYFWLYNFSSIRSLFSLSLHPAFFKLKRWTLSLSAKFAE